MKIYKGAGILFYTYKQSKIDKVLLAKRAILPDKGKWSISGGKMEVSDNNSFLNCAARETNEEFTQREPFQITIINYLYPNFSIEKCKYCTIYIPFIFQWKTFFVPLQTEPGNWPMINCEFSEYKWFNRNELPKDVHWGVQWALLPLRLKTPKV